MALEETKRQNMARIILCGELTADDLDVDCVKKMIAFDFDGKIKENIAEISCVRATIKNIGKKPINCIRLITAYALMGDDELIKAHGEEFLFAIETDLVQEFLLPEGGTQELYFSVNGISEVKEDAKEFVKTSDQMMLELTGFLLCDDDIQEPFQLTGYYTNGTLNKCVN